uniref:Uncharacterized protein n=1 Tax=Aureoumbra lagunensis TaxID=44058 RepID=A0A7S3NNK7_9STRA
MNQDVGLRVGVWRIRTLEELCLRSLMRGLLQEDRWAILQQLNGAPTYALEGLWARAAESDRLCDAVLEGLCGDGSEIESLELGRIPLGVTEHGLQRGLKSLPERCSSVRLGWPSHFGVSATEWLARALVARSQKRGSSSKPTPLERIEIRAAGLGGLQGGVVPSTWSRVFGNSLQVCSEMSGEESSFDKDDHAPTTATATASSSVIAVAPSGKNDQLRSRLLGRAKAAAFADWASLRNVNDGQIKSLLRAAGGSLQAFCIAGASQAEGLFADALRDGTQNLHELRFRDAPNVSDTAAAALVQAVAQSVQAIDFSRTGAGPAVMRQLCSCFFLQRLNLDGCSAIRDDSMDYLLDSAQQLRELSLRRCNGLTAAGLWQAVATKGLALQRLRCDLRRSATLLYDPHGVASSCISEPSVHSLNLSHTGTLHGYYPDESAQDNSTFGQCSAFSAEQDNDDEALNIAPFDSPFRGKYLESLKVMLVGLKDSDCRRKWLEALVCVVPYTLKEFEVRGDHYEGLEVPPPPASRAVLDALRAQTKVTSLSLALHEPEALFRQDLLPFVSVVGAVVSTQLTSLNVSCRGLTASHLQLLFPKGRSSTLRRLGLVSDRKPRRRTSSGGNTSIQNMDEIDCQVDAPWLEEARLEGIALGGRLILKRCPRLSILALRRCELLALDTPFRESAPVLSELSVLESQCQEVPRGPPGFVSSLRRLAVCDDVFFLHSYAASRSSVLRSLALDESESGSHQMTTGPETLGSALLARASARQVIAKGLEPALSVFDGLVGLELLGVRDLTTKHVTAIATACTALRRLRLIKCKHIKGCLCSDAGYADPEVTIASHPNSALDDTLLEPTVLDKLTSPRATTRQVSAEESFAAFWEDDLQFELDEGISTGTTSVPPRGVRFDTNPPPERETPRRRRRSSASVTTTSGASRSSPVGSPPLPQRTVPRTARKERYDTVLQCVVGSSESGPIADVMRSLADSRSPEYREYAKLAALLPREKRDHTPACVRYLAGLPCSRCDLPHLELPAKKAKKLRPLFELITDIDTFRAQKDACNHQIQSWPPPTNRLRGSSTSPMYRRGGNFVSPVSTTIPRDNAGYSSDDSNNAGLDVYGSSYGSTTNINDDLKLDDESEPLLFPRLEALEIERCDAIDSLRLEAPALLALVAARCEKLHSLDLRCPRLTHLDLHRNPRLAVLPLHSKSLKKLKVANLAQTDLPETKLHKLVDHCRFLTYLNVYAVLDSTYSTNILGNCSMSGSIDSSVGSSRQNKRSSGSHQKADPKRTKRKTMAGLDKLKAGRPDLELVRTRKEHEHPVS